MTKRTLFFYGRISNDAKLLVIPKNYFIDS